MELVVVLGTPLMITDPGPLKISVSDLDQPWPRLRGLTFHARAPAVTGQHRCKLHHQQCSREPRVFPEHRQIFLVTPDSPMWLSPIRMYSSLYKAYHHLPGEVAAPLCASAWKGLAHHQAIQPG